MFRSLLFVPGHRPDRFAKAVGTGADAVCIDLEDAVAPPERVKARAGLAQFLEGRERSGAALGMRINCVRSADGVRDLAMLLECRPPDFVMVPKVDDPAELGVFQDAFGGRLPIWPIVESARAIRNLWQIAEAPGVGGLIFGAADYSVDVRCLMEWEPLLLARGLLATAAANARIELLDVPHLDVTDSEGLRATTERVRALGFTGRTCIHPSQIETVHAVFTPSAEEISRAERMIEAFKASKGAVALFEGKLIEKPLILAAEQTLARARAIRGI